MEDKKIEMDDNEIITKARTIDRDDVFNFNTSIIDMIGVAREKKTTPEGVKYGEQIFYLNLNGIFFELSPKSATRILKKMSLLLRSKGKSKK